MERDMTVHRAIFWVHLLTGTLAGLVILVMAVTGVLLAFEPQIVDYAERDLRRVTPPAPDARRLPIDAVLARAEVARPGVRPIAVASWSGPGAAVRVAFSRDDGVFVNPYTGDILGPGSRVHHALHVIEDWHRWLGSRDVGRPYTGACNLAFLGLAVSGLYLWWPRRWTRHVFRGSALFDGSLSGRARDWNWHNVIGFWCAPVLIVLTLTGAVMSYQWANDLLYRLTGNEPPPPPAAGATRPPGQRDGQRPPDARPREGQRRLDGRPHEGQRLLDARPREGQRPLDGLEDRTGRAGGDRPRSEPVREPASIAALWARAEQQVPGWRSIVLRLPPRPGGPVTAFIQEPAPPGPGPIPRSQLTLDPFSAEVAKWEPYADANAGRKLRTWSRYLHTGEVFGIAGQAIAALASAGAVMLVWTGLSLAWRRFLGWNRRRAMVRRTVRAKGTVPGEQGASIE